MDNQKRISPFSSFLFHLTRIDYVTYSTHLKFQSIVTLQHTMIIFINIENGTLTIDDKSCFATNGKVLLLTPGSVIELTDVDKQFSFYQLTFTVIQLGQQEPFRYNDKLFSNQLEYTIRPFSPFKHIAKELYNLQSDEGNQSYFKQQSLFNELLSMLFEHQLQTEQLIDTTKTVEQTIQYVQQHYDQQLTVKQLASMAQVAQWHYREIFQTITGQNPLDYLTELRIKHAKELLQQEYGPFIKILFHMFKM
ncbi:helix-turn-helix transcriptional regulator [Domibacillus aminovorans]|uniref:HTH araC/xylS-type domain-containing protein n=1 Tax=Domibacillus aminovorans TaxID=29332 RepID=A0A177L828_9BACI|nr:helix-turn-helix transcriptional regulator [Domibacillus aminovorans]OAH61462.1 hypothetical protein AWH49_12705 [Domibacillus aminovorans]